MTQVHPTPISDTTLDQHLRLARDRSARGNATRRDWQRVAEINPDIAYRELRDFLRRSSITEAHAGNPFASKGRLPGAVLGFVVGLLLMIALWIILPYARENWMEVSAWRDIATGAQFISTLLVPIGMVLGARWASKREQATSDASPGVRLPKDATFDELLNAFERTQNVGRARVY